MATHPDIQAMLDLDVVRPVDPDWSRDYTEQRCNPKAVRRGFELRPEQAFALYTFQALGALVCTLRVGGGKSLISYGCAQSAIRDHGHKRGILLVPNSVYLQTIQGSLNEAMAWLKDFRKDVSILTIHGRPKHERLARAKSSGYNLMILPYSYLSLQDSEDLLMAIKPEFIIADEAHRLRNEKAAGPRRLFATCKMMASEFGIDPKLAFMSGTLIKRSLFDYWHLVRKALKDGSPLPKKYNIARDLAAATDPNPYYSDALTTHLTRPIIAWARQQFPDQEEEFTFDRTGARRALRQRMSVTRGVVSTTSDDLGVPLLVAPPVLDRKGHEGVEQLDELDKRLEVMGITPSGDEAESSLHIWRYRHELSSGLFHKLYWPEPEQVEANPHCPRGQGSALLKAAKDRHQKVQQFNRTQRKWLDENARYLLDTPMLLANDMAKHGAENVGAVLYDEWRDYKQYDEQYDWLPQRLSEPVLVSDFRFHDALRWAKKLPAKEGGIVWCHHRALRNKAAEFLEKATGREVYCCESNDRQAFNLLTDPKNAHMIFVVTCKGYGIGLNLQHFHHNYFLQWPRSAEVAEQALGRTHRPGQMADEVTVRVPIYTEFDKEFFASTLTESAFIEQKTGSPQRLMLAAYDPVPEIYPPELMRQRVPGFEIPDKETQERLLKKFRFSG